MDFDRFINARVEDIVLAVLLGHSVKPAKANELAYAVMDNLRAHLLAECPPEDGWPQVGILVVEKGECIFSTATPPHAKRLPVEKKSEPSHEPSLFDLPLSVNSSSKSEDGR